MPFRSMMTNVIHLSIYAQTQNALSCVYFIMNISLYYRYHGYVGLGIIDLFKHSIRFGNQVQCSQNSIIAQLRLIL